MGTGKKKIEIEKIIKETSRMVTFSKRRKGLFKKAKQFESMTGSRVASIVLSPTGRPYTCGDVDYAIRTHFSNSGRCMKLLITDMNFHDSNSDSNSSSNVVVYGETSRSKSSSTPKKNSLHNWVKRIDVEQCQNLNRLLMLKQQLEGTKEKIAEDVESFKAFFV
ncbi:MADS-box transcription factor 23-like [Solanum pennellii]|uniref:MADS-box transcription factor 23-like n=1 Tax=Solanum pennellii TaxID=28526 RepID=A0ABM1H7Y6_SOLPN|nr:MADS-box transcription factor 23-like [Solanum pennellii]